ncbi:hypothetical protein C8J57DRAFT_1066970, partial [Mycena rebaudengoi]
IYELGFFYRNHLIRIFRSDGSPVPKVSEHPSRPSMEQVREQIIQEMKTPGTKPGARKHVLLRDGYRCVLTGAYDFDSCKIHPELRDRAIAANASRTNTECAHIFSELVQEGDKANYAASAMAILKIFGISDKAENFVGGNVNKHFNIFTMATNLHCFFDHSEFWLEEVIGEASNLCWCICISAFYIPPSAEHFDPHFFSTIVGPPRQRVTFTVDPDVEAACKAKNKTVPALPSPSLLAIRAACSRVAHMSGAADQVDQLLRDLQGTPVMAEDGSTAELLAARLSQSSRSVRIGLRLGIRRRLFRAFL